MGDGGILSGVPLFYLSPAPVYHDTGVKRDGRRDSIKAGRGTGAPGDGVDGETGRIGTRGTGLYSDGARVQVSS